MHLLADENFPGEAVSALRMHGHDVGELAFHFGLPSSSGIILFRISMSSPDHVANIAVTAIDSRSDWAGHFAVIEEHRIRLTRLPETKH